MKKLFIIGMCFVLVACSAKLQTAAGPIDFVLTPAQVEKIFDIATRRSRPLHGCDVQGINTAGKTIAVLPARNLDQAWGKADGALSYAEAISIYNRARETGKQFIFVNGQGDRFQINVE